MYNILVYKKYDHIVRLPKLNNIIDTFTFLVLV